MRIEIEFDVEQLIGKITDLKQIQIPRAGAIALNQAVYAGQQALKAEAGRVFKDPVPFTLNAFKYEKATPNNLQARVFIRDDAPGGNPPSKYLAPNIYGLKHYPTNFQGATLNTVVRMSGGRVAQVGQRGELLLANLRSPKTRKNKYNNMTPGQFTQILSALNGNISSADIYGRADKGEASVNDQALSKYIYLDETEINEPFFRRRLTNSPKKGIYFVDRRMGSDGRLDLRYYRVMTQVRTPTRAPKFAFRNIAEQAVRETFNKTFPALVLR